MQRNSLIGYSLILGSIGVFIPYTVLTMTFNYPDVLRLPGGEILTAFNAGGASLIFTWFAFALLGTPLLIAYTMIGQQFEAASPHLRWITTFGIFSAFFQMIGLLRWVFVVPVLAQQYVAASSTELREAIVVTFNSVHQFGGVLLGEHLGQLFTVVWTVGVSLTLYRLGVIKKSFAIFGVVTSAIYLLAQAELLATVIPGFPYIGIAGFLGSTLWLVWLVLLGVVFIKRKHS